VALADLVVIGPEAPLSAGLADELRADGRVVFGPGVDGARLETSKAWMKEVLTDAGIPTARHKSFGAMQDEQAVRFLESLPGPYVVKTDYLMEGKGVLVTPSLDEAVADAKAKLEHGSIVIEEGMTGPELTVLCVCDGKRAVALAPSRDHKRIGTGDVGPMTGGMGAFSPVAGVDADAIAKSIVQPTLDALRDRGIDYRGCLYAGLMLTPDGPKIIEYNVRFGDPECQPLMMRLESDLLTALVAARDGVLKDFALRWHKETALCVVMAARGYPGEPKKGSAISGIEAAESDKAVRVFHAGTRRVADGIVADGGRVLGVTALGASPAEAQRRAYAAVDRIAWEDGFCRRDIGWRVVGREG
jgi:phosphoribosylamine---glycine ligase